MQAHRPVPRRILRVRMIEQTRGGHVRTPVPMSKQRAGSLPLWSTRETTPLYWDVRALSIISLELRGMGDQSGDILGHKA